MSLSADLKRAIEADPRTMNRLAKDAGCSPIQLWNFIDGKRGLTTYTLDGLTEALGLRLTPDNRRRR